MQANTRPKLRRSAALCAAVVGALVSAPHPVAAQGNLPRPAVITRFNPLEPRPGEEVTVNVRSGAQLRSVTVRIRGLVESLPLTVRAPARVEAEGTFRVPQNARLEPYTVEIDVIDLRGGSARGAAVLYVGRDRVGGRPGDRPGGSGLPGGRGNGPLGLRVMPVSPEPGDRVTVIVNATRRLRSVPTGRVEGINSDLEFREDEDNEGRRYVARFRVPDRMTNETLQINVQARERDGDTIRDRATVRVSDDRGGNRDESGRLRVTLDPESARAGDRVTVTVRSTDRLRRAPRGEVVATGQTLEFEGDADRYTARFRVPDGQRDGRIRIEVEGRDRDGDLQTGVAVLQIGEGRPGDRGDRGDRGGRNRMTAEVSPDVVKAGDRVRVNLKLEPGVRGDLRGTVSGMDNVRLEFERNLFDKTRVTARFRVPENARTGSYRVEIVGEDAEGRPVRTEASFRVQ